MANQNSEFDNSRNTHMKIIYATIYRTSKFDQCFKYSCLAVLNMLNAIASDIRNGAVFST